MTEEMKQQLDDLTGIHRGLSNLAELEHETIVAGALPFEASADGWDTITDKFEGPVSYGELEAALKKVVG